MQAAVDRLVEARWTNHIHEEWIRNLSANNPTISIERLERTRQLMNDVLPAATIDGYEDHISALNLPDPNDRHVVAAGIAAGAPVILTWNLRDFPAIELKKHNLRRQTPDDFLAGLYDKAPDLIVDSLANARRNLNRTRVSAPTFIDILDNLKLGRRAKRMRNHVTDL